MEKATQICNFIFHWTGVWAVMTYGTVAVVTAYRAVRRKLARRRIRDGVIIFPTPTPHKSTLSASDADERPESAADAVPEAEGDADAKGEAHD